MNGYKTQIAAALVVLTGALQQAGIGIDIPKDMTGAILMTLGVVFFWLRRITKEPAKP